MKTLHFVVVVCWLTAVPSLRAAVLTGPVNALPESSSPFYWGDGTHNLYQTWSMHSATSGWFYAYIPGISNADVYVHSRLANPTTISNATEFPYSTSGSVLAYEGDTVFFRGKNGYYGAWRLDDVYQAYNGTYVQTYLNGRWYFQSDGTANFTPEPGSLCLLSLGGLLLARRRRA